MITEPVLTAKGISKEYSLGSRSVKVLKDVEIELLPGDFTSIMGPSGSGKSTLLHILSGLLSPDSGEVIVNGNDITRMSDSNLTKFRRRNVGLVFQDFNLIPTLTAEENILLPVILDGRSPDPANLDKILHQLEIESPELFFELV